MPSPHSLSYTEDRFHQFKIEKIFPRFPSVPYLKTSLCKRVYLISTKKGHILVEKLWKVINYKIKKNIWWSIKKHLILFKGKHFINSNSIQVTNLFSLLHLRSLYSILKSWILSVIPMQFKVRSTISMKRRFEKSYIDFWSLKIRPTDLKCKFLNVSSWFG